MKHELRPAIHIKKQLEWACRLGGAESLGISKVGQTVLARLMECQIWHQPAGSVALWGNSSEKRQWPLHAFLSGKKLSPSSLLDARHFSFSQYASNAFQAAIPVPELRGGESELVLV